MRCMPYGALKHMLRANPAKARSRPAKGKRSTKATPSEILARFNWDQIATSIIVRFAAQSNRASKTTDIVGAPATRERIIAAMGLTTVGQRQCKEAVGCLSQIDRLHGEPFSATRVWTALEKAYCLVSLLVRTIILFLVLLNFADRCIHRVCRRCRNEQQKGD